ncbi:beta-lactamase/transpeptidase-like protein [Amylocystis lapponica]|nr:beta-lactamase/transpeptidase-like protein [Amylocystis lapponica]
MAVVTSAGSLHEGFWGVRRANETDEKIRGMVDRHSIYRLASISKLFTSLETFILRDRGVLDLDDPIHKVLPQFPYDPVQGPVTYRQLMSHMSGLGRDWPAGDASKSWPKSLDGSGPPGFNGLPFPSFETFMESFKHHDVVMPQYTYPVYCNTGFALLGLANVAANRLAEGDDAPKTHAELMRRDIFGPMGLNGSSFLATRANLDHVTVASINTTEITYDFKDPMNPAGGQMSSLSDLVKVMQTFLDPTRPENLISPYTLREWMRPLHKFWDGVTSVGALWEIYTLVDSYGRPQELYQKSGELAGYHLTFSMVPSTSYGVVVLTTGPTTETLPLNRLIFEQIQSAFDAVLEDAVRGLLVGTWHSSDARGTIAVTFDDGSLFVSEYTLNGTDVLQVMQADGASGAASEKVALWATAEDEYKLAASGGHVGCVSGWVNLDGLGYIDGVSVNLLRVKHDGPEIILELPAIAMEFRRA